MAGLNWQTAPVLIIGVHKAELPFGKEVAKRLLNSGVIPDLKIIKIEKGLDQPHTFRDRKFFYNTYHKEIYLQILQQVKNRYDLIMDLHAGHIQEGRAAEIYSASSRLLGQIEKLQKNDTDLLSKYPIDLFLIVDKDEEWKQLPRDMTICHTIIPGKIWRAHNSAYVGIEIYTDQIPESTEFQDEELRFASEVVRMIWTAYSRGKMRQC